LALVIALADPTPHLFNPRPEEDLRELASERPDVVESARTVDAGHVQAEIEILGTELDGLVRNREPTASLQGASVILRLGLSPRWEFQVHTPRLQLLWPDRSQADRYDVGAGDASLRFKWNLIGNDDGRFALALLPLV